MKKTWANFAKVKTLSQIYFKETAIWQFFCKFGELVVIYSTVRSSLTPPRLQPVLLQLLHLLGGVPVVLLQDPDEVRDGEHADEVLPAGVPQRGGADAVVHQREEGLLDQQLTRGTKIWES